MDIFSYAKVKLELEHKLNSLQKVKDSELWMYFDSGASRSVISTESPIRKHLKDIIPAYGSCSVGNGTPLQYIETGSIHDNVDIPVVADLKYDLFSSVNAAKQGLTSIIDYDLKSGKNNSYTINKITGAVTPLDRTGKRDIGTSVAPNASQRHELDSGATASSSTAKYRLHVLALLRR